MGFNINICTVVLFYSFLMRFADAQCQSAFYCTTSPWFPWSKCPGDCIAAERTRTKGICCPPNKTSPECLTSCNLTKNEVRQTEECKLNISCTEEKADISEALKFSLIGVAALAVLMCCTCCIICFVIRYKKRKRNQEKVSPVSGDMNTKEKPVTNDLPH